MKNRFGYIYFGKHKITGLLKIGFSGCPLTRASSIKLKLLGCIKGSLLTEKAIHEKFSMYRIKNEWFQDCAEIQDFLIATNAQEQIPKHKNSLILRFRVPKTEATIWRLHARREGRTLSNWIRFHVEA